MNTSSKCQIVTGSRSPPPEPAREGLTEFQTPASDALVGDGHASFSQDQFDVPKAEAEHVVQPDRVADDLGREPVPVIGGGLWCHRVSLTQLTFKRQPELTWQYPDRCWTIASR